MKVSVANIGVTIRKLPGTDSPSVGEIEGGTIVEVGRNWLGWYEVENGWIPSWLVRELE